MSRRARCILLVLAALLCLSLPLAAQVRPERNAGAVDSLLRLWQRVVAPITALWSSDITPTTEPPPAPPAPDPETATDGRSTIDPLG